MDTSLPSGCARGRFFVRVFDPHTRTEALIVAVGRNSTMHRRHGADYCVQVGASAGRSEALMNRVMPVVSGTLCVRWQVNIDLTWKPLPLTRLGVLVVCLHQLSDSAGQQLWKLYHMFISLCQAI